MKIYSKSYWLEGFLIMNLLVSAGCTNTTKINIVPQPVKIAVKGGIFKLTPDTVIIAEKATYTLGEQLAEVINPATGYALNVTEGKDDIKNSIVLRLNQDLQTLGDEGYKLNISEVQVSLEALRPAGIFYGIQSIRHLLPVEIFNSSKTDGVKWQMPCVQIEDYPRFSWRGMHLDVCRHFMPKEFVKKYIDLLAMHKMNRFHWHLTEDQGWRIEIKKYPKLTEVGAWRKETLVGLLKDKPMKFDGIGHGGFYTQDEVREIVEYARQRYVTVVPEIDMPGHMQAAIAAYPELGTTGEKVEVLTYWGGCINILNVNEPTILFMQDVLTEVMDLFPSEFIHIGGDEVSKDQWKQSPQMQGRIKELGLENEEQLQSYFIKRMDTFLAEKGRRLIGWDEILEGGLAPQATVMSWRGEKGGITAAKAGHDVVMAPWVYTYFDHYQADPNTEPLGIGGFLPLEKVYRYNPVPKELSEEQGRHVLGAQGQIWTEYIAKPENVEYMAYPRASALAEVVWTDIENKDYDNFIERLQVHLERLKKLNVNYRPLD